MIRLDPQLISDHSSLQREHGREFLELWKETREMGDLEGETALDMGCGPGNNSTKFILDYFPKLQKIIATDVSEDMIGLARTHSGHPKVEYVVADAQDKSAFLPWSGAVDKVFSFFMLHWVQDQEQAFRNMYDVLRPGGEAAVVFALSAPNFETAKSLMEDAKWRGILKDVPAFVPESQIKCLDAEHYKMMFSAIGFEVIFCKRQERVYEFKTDENLKRSLSSVCSLKSHVPENHKKEFEEYVLRKYKLIAYGDSQDSRTDFKFANLSVALRKPT